LIINKICNRDFKTTRFLYKKHGIWTSTAVS